MGNFLLSRAKAWIGLFAPAATLAAIKAAEGSLGIDIPVEIEATILGVVTGFFVHQIPNKTV